MENKMVRRDPTRSLLARVALISYVLLIAFFWSVGIFGFPNRQVISPAKQRLFKIHVDTNGFVIYQTYLTLPVTKSAQVTRAGIESYIKPHVNIPLRTGNACHRGVSNRHPTQTPYSWNIAQHRSVSVAGVPSDWSGRWCRMQWPSYVLTTCRDRHGPSWCWNSRQKYGFLLTIPWHRYRSIHLWWRVWWPYYTKNIRFTNSWHGALT